MIDDEKTYAIYVALPDHVPGYAACERSGGRCSLPDIEQDAGYTDGVVSFADDAYNMYAGGL